MSFTKNCYPEFRYLIEKPCVTLQIQAAGKPSGQRGRSKGEVACNLFGYIMLPGVRFVWLFRVLRSFELLRTLRMPLIFVSAEAAEREPWCFVRRFISIRLWLKGSWALKRNQPPARGPADRNFDCCFGQCIFVDF